MADSPLGFADLADMDVGMLAGIGSRKLSALRGLGVESLLDLVTHFPRRYVDRSNHRRTSDLRAGEDALVLARLSSVSSRRTRNRRTMVVADFTDGSGSLRCTFFNQPWRQKQLESPDIGDVALFGRVEVFNGRRQMTNPVVDLVGTQTGKIVPIYPLSEKSGLNSSELASWTAQTLRRSSKRGILDPVPESMLAEHGLVGRGQALTGIHFPESMAQMVTARKRLVFDELLRIQVSLVARKREIEQNERGFQHLPDGPSARSEDLLGQFHRALPFELTGAQERAIAEIADDLASPVPMHRLLQGDVGAGKTLVALLALLTVVKAGHQGAFMAPTEVLAEQHARSLRSMLEGLTVSDEGSLLGERPLTVGLLTGSIKAAERKRLLADLKVGRIDILVGTHALLEEQVRFGSLGMAVIDEQHRFGVEQRATLRAATDGDDAAFPDVLVMTATPIPRTAAMTVYGDLDITVLDQLPAGRTPIQTSWAASETDTADAWELVRDQVVGGRQSYVVCPLVEGSEKIEAASAQETYEDLSTGELRGLRLGLLHGRMGSEDKDAVMGSFRDGRIDVLVATTVIEVGVDVRNATVMVILDADRFGLAQLHQLRGRVGRGSERSHCVLVTNGEISEEGTARLEAMVSTTDGFKLAEVDLELRGEGTIMGQRQKGRTDLKLASLRRDVEWIVKARQSAFELVDRQDLDSALEQILDETKVIIREEEADFLEKG